MFNIKLNDKNIIIKTILFTRSKRTLILSNNTYSTNNPLYNLLQYRS